MFRQQRAHGRKDMLAIGRSRTGTLAIPLLFRVIRQIYLVPFAIQHVRRISHARFFCPEALHETAAKERFAFPPFGDWQRFKESLRAVRIEQCE